MPVVEFIGVPGAGKSTLVEKLEDILSDPSWAGMPMEASRRPRVWSKIVTVLLYSRALAAATRSLASDERSVSRRLRALRWFVSTLEIYNTRGKGVILIPEGTLQRAVLLFFTPGMPVNRDLLDRYLRVVPLGDLVVRIVVSPTEAVQRNEVRIVDPNDGRSNPRFMDAEVPPEQAFSDANAFIRLVVSEVERHRGVPVMTIHVGDQPTGPELVYGILSRLNTV